MKNFRKNLVHLWSEVKACLVEDPFKHKKVQSEEIKDTLVLLLYNYFTTSRNCLQKNKNSKVSKGEILCE